MDHAEADRLTRELVDGLRDELGLDGAPLGMIMGHSGCHDADQAG